MKELVRRYGKGPGAKVLILLEHEGQVKDYRHWSGEIRGHKQVIALSPFASYELDKQQAAYRIPEDYYDSQELFRLGQDNYQKVENICKMIDNGLQKACPAITGPGIKPALFSIYQLKTVYDAVTVCLFQLLKIIDVETPDVILVYATRRYPFGISGGDSYLYFDTRESIYTRVLALSGWSVPVEVLPYVPPPEVNARRINYAGLPARLKNRLAAWFRLSPELLALATTFQKSGWRGLPASLRAHLPAGKHTPALLFGGGHNWEDCIEELQSAGISPIFRIFDDLEHWIGKPSPDIMDCGDTLFAWEKLRLDDELRRYFVWGSIDFFAIVEDRLRFLVERLTPACLKAYRETAKLLKSKRVGAVLARTFSTCTAHTAAQAARHLGIPVVIWQHGSCGYMHQPVVIYNDLMNANINFVFGEGVLEHYAEPARHSGTRLVPVGSASLDLLAQRLRSAENNEYARLEPGKKVVLYVVSDFLHSNPYISISPPYSDNLCWSTQQAILDTLARHQDYSVVVKLPPSPDSRNDLLSQYAREKSLGNCRFVSGECSFKDLLPLADVLVIDFPMTTLLEALATSKPVFVYTGRLHIDEDAQRLLERRASCHRELEGFTEALDRFLSGDSIDMGRNDREFLKRYGTADGAAGEKAVAILRQIIKSYETGQHCCRDFQATHINNNTNSKREQLP